MNDLLHRTTEELLSELWDFSKKTETSLQQLGALRLPIDIGDFARELGFTITYDEFFSDKDYGYTCNKTIVLKQPLSYKEERFGIAKSIANFLINRNKEALFISNSFFVNPNVDDYYLDVLAILLLFPISLFKEAVSKHIGENCFLQHLSDITQIPLFQFSMCYPLMKQMLAFQRIKMFEACNYDVTQVPFDQYENIFI